MLCYCKWNFLPVEQVAGKMRNIGICILETSYSHSFSVTGYYRRIEYKCKMGGKCYRLNLVALYTEYRAVKST